MFINVYTVNQRKKVVEDWYGMLEEGDLAMPILEFFPIHCPTLGFLSNSGFTRVKFVPLNRAFSVLCSFLELAHRPYDLTSVYINGIIFSEKKYFYFNNLNLHICFLPVLGN